MLGEEKAERAISDYWENKVSVGVEASFQGIKKGVDDAREVEFVFFLWVTWSHKKRDCYPKRKTLLKKKNAFKNDCRKLIKFAHMMAVTFFPCIV